MNSTESTVQESNTTKEEGISNMNCSIPIGIVTSELNTESFKDMTMSFSSELIVEKDVDATTDPLIRKHIQNLFDDWIVLEKENDGCDSYGFLYWVFTKYWSGRSYDLEPEMRKCLDSHFEGILEKGHVFLKDYDDIEDDTRRFYTKESLARIYREFWDKYNDC